MFVELFLCGFFSLFFFVTLPLLFRFGFAPLFFVDGFLLGCDVVTQGRELTAYLGEQWTLSPLLHQILQLLRRLQRGNGVPQASSMRFVSIEDVTDTLLAQLCPTVIISPALSKRFDCIDLAQLLCRLEYRGRYRAVSHELPNPKMIEREIRSICPNLDFGVLTSD